MADENAEFWSVKLTTDTQGGFGPLKKGQTAKNLSRAQANALHQSGFADEPKAQKGYEAEGKTAEAVKP